MKLTAPRVTSDRLCCPGCRQRVPYRPDGLPDLHWLDDAGTVTCPATWPPFYVGRTA